MLSEGGLRYLRVFGPAIADIKSLVTTVEEYLTEAAL